MIERITFEQKFDGAMRKQHEHRYEVASKFIEPSDIVLDSACGIGYGHKFLGDNYIGIDKISLCGNIVANLNTYQPDFEFDVAVCFETLEHLENYKNWVEALKKAKKLIAYSSPIIPTAGINPAHVQDFTYDQLKNLFSDWGEIVHEETQGENGRQDVYGLFVVKRFSYI
jgi:hypothetical protein